MVTYNFPQICLKGYCGKFDWWLGSVIFFFFQLGSFHFKFATKPLPSPPAARSGGGCGEKKHGMPAAPAVRLKHGAGLRQPCPSPSGRCCLLLVSGKRKGKQNEEGKKKKKKKADGYFIV